MRGGRAPCCDKSQVVRGPWSPAEDFRLISYIQKYGHDNWRALPKQAGLLRCGKSCRLRWINYLRPDLKRGSFTKQEEEEIIQLHQTIGNKWSKIAAQFPGRTDNEIKNVWNTLLKKRLSKKAGAESKQEETSAITTSSSSSTTTAESTTKNKKIEIESHIKPLSCNVRAKTDETGSSEMHITPNQSVGENQLHVYQQSGQLLNSCDVQLEQFTVWDDPNLLESLLSAVDNPEWALASHNAQVESSGNNFSGELPMVSDNDLWNMLNSDDQQAASGEEYITDREIDIMFEYLDNEQGLAQMLMEMHGDDDNHGGPAGETGNEASMNYFTLWPHSWT